MLINRLIWFKKGAEGVDAFSGEAELSHLTQNHLQEIFAEDDRDELMNGMIPLNSEQLSQLVVGTNIVVSPAHYDYLFEIVTG